MPPSEPEPSAIFKRYAEERRRLVLTRLRWTAFLAFIPIVVSVAVNVAVFTDRLPERLATLVVQASLCVAGLILARGPRAARRAIPVAMGLVMGMSTSLFWSVALAARPRCAGRTNRGRDGRLDTPLPLGLPAAAGGFDLCGGRLPLCPA